MTTNTWPRRLPAILAVLLLSVPSAAAVHDALAPTRGDLAGYLAAAGFELLYLSTAILILTSDLRRYAQRVALAAVLTAIILNMLANYAARVPGGLASTPAFMALFDPLALVLSLVESVPLAGLSYAMATLLHRLSEQAAVPGGTARVPSGTRTMPHDELLTRPLAALARPIVSGVPPDLQDQLFADYMARDVPSEVDRLTYAADLRAAGTSWRAVAAQVGMSVSTLRRHLGAPGEEAAS